MPESKPTPLTFELLMALVSAGAVAFRIRQRLQPAGGPGDKVYPPTYATGENTLKYAVETRRLDGRDVPCVLLDSVASQANRLEEALLGAWERNSLDFPVVGVDFSDEANLADIGSVTSLQAPHRLADAILRDATTADGKVLFRDTPEGKAYTEATIRNASAVYLLCPTALIFGVWDSTGPKGGLGAKFQRSLCSEIVAIDARAGKKVGSRIDPLSIQAIPVYQHKDDASEWTSDVSEARQEKGKAVPFSRKGGGEKGKASAINHSNIAPTIDEFAGGITFDYAIQTTVLSLPAVRRLRFATGLDGKRLSDCDAAGEAARVALTALALAAIVRQRENGYDLRSRCLLVAEEAADLECVKPDGTAQRLELGVAAADDFVKRAQEAAAKAELAWKREPIKLKPAPKLAALIRKSREQMAADATE